MVLRSDELASQAEVERDQKFRSNVGKGVSAAAAVAGAGLSAGVASKIAPFLSQYIPVDLALKGINKVSPRMGALLKKGQDMGLDVKQGLDFIKQKLDASQPAPAQSAKDNRNIIEQYSPELDQFIRQHIQNGKTAEEAGALAQMDSKSHNFKSAISKLTKDHNTSWSSILTSVYGGQAPKKRSGPVGELLEKEKQATQQAAQPLQQGGDKWAQIASTLENLLKS